MSANHNYLANPQGVIKLVAEETLKGRTQSEVADTVSRQFHITFSRCAVAGIISRLRNKGVLPKSDKCIPRTTRRSFRSGEKVPITLPKVWRDDP